MALDVSPSAISRRIRDLEDRIFEHFFLDLETKAEFLEQTLKWPCFGSAEFTFCDVEIVAQSRITTANLLAIIKAQRDSDVTRRERELLERLKAKYEPMPRPDARPDQAPPTAPEPSTVLRQGSRFEFSE
nr:LysR family transcriptional regulator [Methylosinus sp. RM1]